MATAGLEGRHAALSRSTTGRIAVGRTPGVAGIITGHRRWGSRGQRCWAAHRRDHRAALACCRHRPATGCSRCRPQTCTHLGGKLRLLWGVPGGRPTTSVGGAAGPCCEGAPLLLAGWVGFGLWVVCFPDTTRGACFLARCCAPLSCSFSLLCVWRSHARK